MPLNVNALRDWVFEDRRQAYTDRDTMLYALGVGFGADPMDLRELPFVYEERGLRAVPTMASVLCYLGPWIGDPRTGATRSHVVHGEQRMTFHAPLPPTGELIARSRVLGVEDKGAGKGALVHTERVFSDARTQQRMVTIVQTSFCRADGGFGQGFGPTLELHALPQRAPDRVDDVRIRLDAALLYRLNADRNPLHADPDAARKAGFDRPILHGLCSFGIAARVLLAQWLDYDPARMASLQVRFSSPVIPGETLRVESWRDGDVLSFQAHVVERGKKALDNGRAQIRG